MGLVRIPLCFMVQLKTKPLEQILICILEFFEIPGPQEPNNSRASNNGWEHEFPEVCG